MTKLPNIPPHVPTPCRNPEVSGRRTSNGQVVDLWAGDSGSTREVDRKATYQEAAALCNTVCKTMFPSAFNECARYQRETKPEHMVFGGVIPPQGLDNPRKDR